MNAAASVGVVQPQRFAHNQSFNLEQGGLLPSFELVYETYGTLNATGDNAVLICHALSGHHHAAGIDAIDGDKVGWWDNMIGPHQPIDTTTMFVVSSNNLGGCHGSTGPTSIDPQSGRAYGADFPIVTVPDWVRSQKLLMEHLHIQKWAAIVGGSLGGMQAMQWSIDYPNDITKVVVIAAAANLTTQNIAFNEVARQNIQRDPNFFDGRYIEHGTYPKQGLTLARMLGHITYVSDSSLRAKFGRSRRSLDLPIQIGNNTIDFEVESYLKYQGERFSEKFDANTYLLMTRALDYFDPSQAYAADLVAAMQRVHCKYLIIAFSSDWRFSPKQSQIMVDALLHAQKDVSYLCIQSEHGHDSFLMNVPQYHQAVSYFLRAST